MFDDSTSLENQTPDAQKASEEEEKASSSVSRWSALIAMVVFCLIYFPFKNHPWSWLIAIAVSYSVAAFGVALGSALKDSDDFFGDSCVLKSLQALLLPHALILSLVMLGPICGFASNRFCHTG
jgi:hypothetical protein